MRSAATAKPLAKDWPSLVVLALVCLILVQQTRFLFVYPVPDTGMWFGDESWSMLTARAMVETGVARIPEAVGSSLAQSNGLVNGSIWITGLMYGLPAHFLGWYASPVTLGRTVTLLLCIISLVIVYRVILRLTSNRFAALASLLALVTSDAFAFSSHSARFDAATGLAVLAYLAFLVFVFERRDRITPQIAFALTFSAVLSLAVYVHVPTLIALPALYTMWRVRLWKNTRLLIAAIIGAACSTLLVVGLYRITTGSLDLLGKGYNQYYNVANSLPIVHPFSWQVQKINTIDRALQVWDVAWPLVSLIVVCGIFAVLYRGHFTESQRFWMWLTMLTIIGWCALEGPAVFYNIHVLPTFAVMAGVLFGVAFPDMRWRFVLLVLATILSALTIANQQRRGKTGIKLTSENNLASFLEPAFGKRVMVDEPALNESAYLERTSAHLKLATKHFLLFGAEKKSASEILREHDVDYLLLYSTIRYQSQVRPIADSLYTVIAERTGHFTDQARSYDDPHWNELDTVRLYKMK
jgi:hypothetical protein